MVAAETTRMPMVFADAKNPEYPIIFANDSYLELTGYAREEVLGQTFMFALANKADSHALAQIKAELEGRGNSVEILYKRKDGSDFWAATYIHQVRDKGGGLIEYFMSFVDLTEHKQEQARSRMLIDELNHRVKNTLANVQSIVWQVLRTVVEPKLISEAIESRLLALSRAHDLLTRENWRSAGLRDLITTALESFTAEDGRMNRIVIKGENIRFVPQQALALGIAFNELATNAVKYGAFSNAAGSILIDWKPAPASQGKRLLLRWQEKGGPPVAKPSRKGFGSRMIERGLALELEGEVQLDYPPEGLICTMNIPAPQGDRHG